MRKLKKILFGMVFGLFFISSVSADTLDNLNVSLIKKSSTEGGLEQSFLYIQNVDSETSYSVLYSADNNVPNEITDNSVFDTEVYSSSVRDSSLSGIDSFGYTNYASMYGNVYITLYVYNNSKYEKVSNSILVERPTIAYGKRMDVGLYSSTNSADVLIHDIYNRNSNINIKVGEITDESLLENFALSKDYTGIISFAKNDSNAVITFSGSTSSSFDGKYDSSKIVDDKYYYIYLSIDTENGKYHPLDEIFIAKANNKNLLSDFDFEFTKEEQGNPKESEPVVITTNKDDKKTSETTANPKTGVYSGSILIVASAIVGYIVIRRKNKLKNI